MAEIDKKRICDLITSDKKDYFIPDYQRGYKWTDRQVSDLLTDITEYTIDDKSLYLLQPVVVKDISDKVVKDKIYNYEIIDGQQRLTTIYIVLCYLLNKQKGYLLDNGTGKKITVDDLYIIEYETRLNFEKSLGSGEFLGSGKYLGFFKDYAGNKNIIEEYKDSNSDFYYMNNTYEKVRDFFEKGEGQGTEETFLKKILEYTQIIWYVTNGSEEGITNEKEEKSTDIFKRLNIGKIKLENSELLKALFLNSSNFVDNVGLKQASIAIEWDNIEYTLQNEQFWYFIYGEQYESFTRINYIFDLIRKLDLKNVKGLYENKPDDEKNHKSFKEFIGTDDQRTFRYIDFYISETLKKYTDEDRKKHSQQIIEELWSDVKKIFRIFKEWYNDIELYHYVGFLINCKRSDKMKAKDRMFNILQIWNNLCGIKKDGIDNENVNKGALKSDFLECLKEKITEQLKEDFKYNELVNNKNHKGKDYKSLVDLLNRKCFFDSRDTPEKNFDGDIDIDKTNTYNLLLLHNLQTIINQHKNYEKHQEKFVGGVFYKFPFNLFKLDDWDIEHINPAVPREIKSSKDIKDYLMGANEATYLFEDDKVLKDGLNLKQRINKALGICYKNKPGKPLNDEDLVFCQELINDIAQKDEAINGDELKINYLKNYVLLDRSTNSGYGNAFFSGKRTYIIGKDKAEKITLYIDYDNKDLDTYKVKTKKEKDDKFISFILPCTKNVFLKYYTSKPNNLLKWDDTDANSYLKNILEVLEDFIGKDEEEGEQDNE